MKRRAIYKLLAFSFLLVCAMPTVMPKLEASANSAQTYWQGVDSLGTVIMEEHCPIEVQHEKLVFDIPDFPSNHYGSLESFKEYSASVSATYTFYNPANYAVKATLAFPFGELPYYAPYVYDEETGEKEPFPDTEKYAITVDGKEIEKKLRYTLSGASSFDIYNNLLYLGDTYVDDDFYKADLPVHIYYYEVSGISSEYKSAYASFTHNSDKTKTRIWVESANCKTDEQGSVFGKFVSNGNVIAVYVFGEELSYTPNWTVYERASKEKVITAEIQENPIKRRTMDFEKFAFTCYFGNYTEQSTIPIVDWYNAVVYSMNANATNYGVVEDYGLLRIERSFMRWYQYEIEIPAKSTIVNTVTAPIYPSIDVKWEPSVYGYTYLLSPAKTWSKFGKLDIEINTPYFIIDDKNGFTKTETGYAMSLNGLPEGELKFTLSSSADARKPVSCFGCYSSVGLFTATPITLLGAMLLLKKRK